MAVFVEGEGDGYETADFPLSELSLDADILAALSTAGYTSFLDIIDLDRTDFLAVEGVTEDAATSLLSLIEDLTVPDSEGAEPGTSEAGAGPG